MFPDKIHSAGWNHMKKAKDKYKKKKKNMTRCAID